MQKVQSGKQKKRGESEETRGTGSEEVVGGLSQRSYVCYPRRINDYVGRLGRQRAMGAVRGQPSRFSVV